MKGPHQELFFKSYAFLTLLLGFAISGLFAVQSHCLAVSAMVPIWTAQGLLAILFGVSYLNARDLGPRWWPQRS